MRLYEPIPSRAAPTAMSIASGACWNIAAMGTRTRFSSRRSSSNSGVSVIDQRKYNETSSNGRAMRNGMRQPQAAS